MLLLLLLLLVTLPHAHAQCATSLFLTFQEPYLRVATRVPAYQCSNQLCAGDQILAQNPLQSETGAGVGNVDAICTMMKGLDRALCRWNFYFAGNSEIQLLGVSFPIPENATEIIVLGGTNDYEGVTGTGTTHLSQSHDRRWFELFLCFPEDGPSSTCSSEDMKFYENEPVNDVVIPATPTLFSTGLVDLFSNTISVEPNSFGVDTGMDNGLCTYLGRRWICQWNTLLPDENNKIFLQGSISGLKDVQSVVPVVGGTGSFLNARGKATVIARQSTSSYSYFWEILPSFTYGCLLFPNHIRLQFQQNVGVSTVARSKIGRGVTPYPGDVRIFIDDAYSTSKRNIRADGKATGSCTMLNEDDRHYCEWIIQYPLDGTANGKGSNQLVVIGTVYDAITLTSTVAVVGGTGLWSGAHGSGTYTPLRNPIADNVLGSPVGILDIEFSYF